MKRIKGYFNKLTAVFTAFALVLSVFLPLCVFAADPQARTISIFELEGNNIVMTKGTAKEHTAKAGQKLSEGYTVATGQQSYCYLLLDDNSLLKMNQSSKIAIAKASRSKLSISLLSGAALVNAGEQKAGNTIETRAGNTALAIRGTLYVIEYKKDGDNTVLSITMLEGAGEVNGRLLPEGFCMIVYEDPDTSEQVYKIIPEIALEDASLFTLEAIYDYRKDLIEAGLITEEDVKTIEELMGILREQGDDIPEETQAAAPEYLSDDEMPAGAPGSESGMGNSATGESGEKNPEDPEDPEGPKDPEDPEDPETPKEKSEAANMIDANTGGTLSFSTPTVVDGDARLREGGIVIANGGELTVSEGSSLLTDEGTALTVEAGGKLIINGTLETLGNLYIAPGSEVYINSPDTWDAAAGEVNNLGTIYLTENGRIVIREGVKFYNHGENTFVVTDGAKLEIEKNAAFYSYLSYLYTAYDSSYITMDTSYNTVLFGNYTYVITPDGFEGFAYDDKFVKTGINNNFSTDYVNVNAYWAYDEEGCLYIFGTYSEMAGGFLPSGDINNIKSAYIHLNILYIGDEAFMNMINLEKVEFATAAGESNLYSIGNRAFSGCTSLREIWLPEKEFGIIRDNAFENCSALTSIYIPYRVNIIGEWGTGMSSLTSIIVNSSNTTYTSIDGVLFESDYAGQPAKLCVYPIGKTDAYYYVPDTVQEICGRAFYGSNLENIVIPGNVIRIESEAFANCPNLKSVTFLGVLPEYCANNIFDGVSDGLIIYYDEGQNSFILPPWSTDFAFYLDPPYLPAP